MPVGVDHSDLVLRFDHNVIEHLGLKLYQNRPTNVLAEMVSNSWDADAQRVWIDFSFNQDENYIAIGDDGFGMDLEVIKNSYLIIGLPKRERETPNARSTGGRHLMGRKGIGKLAPFGIATKVDILSFARDENNNTLANWFRLSLDGIRQAQLRRDNAYFPESVLKEGTIEDVRGLANKHSLPVIEAFINKIQVDENGKPRNIQSGTIVLLSGLTLKKALSQSGVIEGMGRRFTVTLLRDDFSVSVNGSRVTEAVALPTFGQRIPETGFSTEVVNGREVRYWVGFVETAAWSSDQAGVGVYAHGKIAQDRPFTFGQKGREIQARYMYGIVEADWLDELTEDVVSTDRTSVDWDHDDTMPLYQWGNRKVTEWLGQQLKWRHEHDKRAIVAVAKTRRAAGQIPNYTEFENDKIVELVAQIAPSLGKDPESEAARDRLLDAVANAWSARPVRELLKSIWDEMKDAGDLAGPAMAAVVENLRTHSVPEALSLGVTFAQRAYALSLMYDLIHKGREIDLQELLETFPWILDPRGSLLTADRSLKKVVTDTILAVDGDPRIGREIRSLHSISDRERPDFVFLTGADGNEIVVVEIKHPANPLTDENRRQLVDYLDFLGQRYRHRARRGILIGNQQEGIEVTDTRIKTLNWDQLFQQSRYAYIEMMAAMLKAADPDPSDSRVKMMEEFGGEQTWELLRRFAERDEELKHLFELFDANKASTSATH